MDNCMSMYIHTRGARDDRKRKRFKILSSSNIFCSHCCNNGGQFGAKLHFAVPASCQSAKAWFSTCQDSVVQALVSSTSSSSPHHHHHCHHHIHRHHRHRHHQGLVFPPAKASRLTGAGVGVLATPGNSFKLQGKKRSKKEKQKYHLLTNCPSQKESQSFASILIYHKCEQIFSPIIRPLPVSGSLDPAIT